MKRIVIGSLALALAGCGGAARLAPPAGPLAQSAVLRGPSEVAMRGRPSWISPQARTSPVIFVANQGNATITIYPATAATKNPPPIGILSEGVTNPVALAVDAAGSLYVVNQQSYSGPGYPPDVAVYPRGSVRPSRTYSTGLSIPVAAALGGDGTLYVADNGNPNIIVYPPGSTTPSATLTDQNANSFYALAIDAQNDLYVTYQPYTCCPQPSVDEFIAGYTVPVTLGISDQTGRRHRGIYRGIVLAAQGDLVLSDGQQIAAYAPSATVWPSIDAPRAVFGFRGNPIALSTNKNGKQLFAVDSNNSEVLAYTYPGGLLYNTYSNGVKRPTAVAAGPAEPAPARSPQPPPPTPSPSPSPTPTPAPTLPAGTLYVEDGGGGGSVLGTYDASTGSLQSSFTLGSCCFNTMAIDSTGNLYVGNTGNSNILVYAPGQTSPFETISSTLTNEYGVAVGSDGTVVADNTNSPAAAVVFPPGSTNPSETLTDPTFTGVSAVGIDASNNVYAAYNNGSPGWRVMQFLNGSTTGTDLGIALPSSEEPYQFLFDASGDMLVSAASLLVFPPGATSPTQTIGSGTLNTACGMALDQTQSFLYVADCGQGNVDVFTYPAGAFVTSFPTQSNEALGLALYPPAVIGPPWSHAHRVRHPARTKQAPRHGGRG